MATTFDARRMRQGMSKALDGFTTGQKAMMALAVVAVVVGVTLFSRSGSGPAMVPLFTGLEAADAGAITGQLDGAGVPYELGDGGRTVLVPQSDVYRLRIDMSAQGLPSGGNDGWSLIDGQGITASAFRQRIDYQRALSGELARTIEALDGVSAAKVNIVVPQNDVFVGDDERSTASVLVMTKSGRTLGEDQVRSIVNLVASAVPSLTPDAVTVADSTGRPLWTPATDEQDGGFSGGFPGGSDATRKTMEFEAQMGKRLEDLVATIAGPGRARVQVKAQLDLDEKASKQEIHQAPNTEGEAPLIESQTKNDEQYTNADPSVGGVLGPEGTPVEPGAAGSSTNYQSSSDQTDYAINKLQEEVRYAPGQVLGMSVAVALDDKSAVDVDTVRRLVSAAAGLAEGDVVTVEKVPFDTSAADEAKEELEAAAKQGAQDDPMRLVQTVLVGLLVAAVLFMSWRSLRKAAKRARAERPIDLRELEAVREAMQPMPAIALGAADAASASDGHDEGLALPPAEELRLPAGPAPDAIVIEPVELSLAAKTSAQYELEIRDMIETQTAEVASVIRGWLTETKRTRR